MTTWRRAVLSTATVLALAAVLGQPERGVRAQTPEDPQLLRELATRLLSSIGPRPAGEAPQIELLPGAAPADLPFALPRPAGSRLIGSVVRPIFDGGPVPRAAGRSIEVVLDVPGRPESAFTAFERALGEQGWSAPPTGPRRPGGFQPALQALSTLLCKGSGSDFISLAVLPLSAELSDVRVRADQAPVQFGPCQIQPIPPQGPPAFDLLPPLTTPAGARILTSFGGGGPGRFTSDAVAEGDLGPAQLEAAFAEQLRAAGWERRAGGDEGVLVWSTWSVPGDEPYQGFLYALQGPAADQLLLHVEIQSSRVFGPFPGVPPIGR